MLFARADSTRTLNELTILKLPIVRDVGRIRRGIFLGKFLVRSGKKNADAVLEDLILYMSVA